MNRTFRKKPVEIEAMQWTGGNTAEVIAFAGVGTRDVSLLTEPPALAIRTLEGTMRADEGDWIIRGVQGEHYPCKPDIFEATYESAEVPAPDVSATREQLAAAFTEWDRRYREEPDRFAAELLLHSGTPETYGDAAAPYLLAILADMKGCVGR